MRTKYESSAFLAVATSVESITIRGTHDVQSLKQLKH